MSWFLLTILSAIAAAAERTFMKISKKERVDTVVLSRFLFAAFPTLLVLPFFGIPEIGAAFWPAAIVASALDVAAITLMVKALDHSSMSRSIPLLAFSPALC